MLFVFLFVVVLLGSGFVCSGRLWALRGGSSNSSECLVLDGWSVTHPTTDGRVEEALVERLVTCLQARVEKLLILLASG